MSCKKTAVKYYSKKDCEKYVAAKNGFYLDIYLKNINERKILFNLSDKQFFPEMRDKDFIKASFFISEKIKLSDTMECIIDDESFKIYDFKNITETAVDVSDHKKIEICRISTAEINGEIIPDSHNNVLKVVLK